MALGLLIALPNLHLKGGYIEDVGCVKVGANKGYAGREEKGREGHSLALAC